MPGGAQEHGRMGPCPPAHRDGPRRVPPPRRQDPSVGLAPSASPACVVVSDRPAMLVASPAHPPPPATSDSMSASRRSLCRRRCTWPGSRTCRRVRGEGVSMFVGVQFQSIESRQSQLASFYCARNYKLLHYKVARILPEAQAVLRPELCATVLLLASVLLLVAGKVQKDLRYK